MPAYESNIDDVAGWIDEAFEEIGWGMPASHGGGTLGAEVIDTVIDGIQARSLVKRGADSLGGEEEWLDNHPEYRKKKERTYGEHNPNFRTTQMLSRDSLRGDPVIGHEETTWPYGTGRPSADGRTKHDRTITDVEKARYAEEGQSEHRIRRPFFAVTEEDADDALIVVEDAVAAHFQRKAQNP